MATSQDLSRRAARLQGLFRDAVAGKRSVRSPQDAQLFLEAVRSQPSPSQCVEILGLSAPGLDAVRDAVRVDLSVPFVASHTLPFLRYLAEPGVKALADGQHLRRVLLVVTDPPTVLNALIDLFSSRQIPEDALFPFAWLALELISLPPDTPVDVVKLVACVADSEQILKCQDHTTRELGYKIQKVAQIRRSSSLVAQPGGPGGRHDNDKTDFRLIRTYPTTDEFLSTQTPYYLTSADVLATKMEERPRVHLDNQFRLLREDMLAELREDIQVAMGKKKGNRRATPLGNFVPVGIDIGDSTTGRYKRCTLLLECYAGLQWIQGQHAQARKKMLKDHPSSLKHQAFGVLCRDNEILGFASVHRDIDNLAKDTPIVSLQFIDHGGLRQALLSLALPTRSSVQFFLVDTPVFAYEPVLLGLQRATDVPLLDLLVDPLSISDSSFEIPKQLRPFVAKLETSPNDGDGTVRIDAALTGQTQIDESQLAALLLALRSPVSLIQGPPGMHAASLNPSKQ